MTDSIETPSIQMILWLRQIIQIIVNLEWIQKQISRFMLQNYLSTFFSRSECPWDMSIWDKYVSNYLVIPNVLNSIDNNFCNCFVHFCYFQTQDLDKNWWLHRDLITYRRSRRRARWPPPRPNFWFFYQTHKCSNYYLLFGHYSLTCTRYSSAWSMIKIN